MKLSDSKETYYYLSGTASSVNRQIGFAGIAIIWIFCQVQYGKVLIPSELIIPTIFIILSLGFDLLQYIVGSIVWGSFHRYYEKKGEDENFEVKAPKYFTYPQNICFAIKILSMFIAYGYLLSFVISNVSLS